MRFLIILLFLMVVMASSCNEDSFSQTVDIPIPEHEPLPAITLDLRSGDTAIYYRLALSRGILESNEITNKDATVGLFRDGNSLFDVSFPLINTDGGNTELRLGGTAENTISADPATYRLVATIEGFDPVEATQEMPAKPDYTVVNYEPDGAIDSEGFRVDEFEIDLVDNPDTEDYYGFRVLLPSLRCEYDQQLDSVICTSDFSFVQEAFMDSPDPLLNVSSGFGLVVSDQSFNGNTYRIRFTADNYTDARPKLEVYHLTEDAYRYGLSRRAYENAGDNPFAEPVNVHQNVTDGYGHFIVSNRVVEQL